MSVLGQWPLTFIPESEPPIWLMRSSSQQAVIPAFGGGAPPDGMKTPVMGYILPSKQVVG
jgi:hypothetical protein